MYSTNAIKRYILYLITECGLSISLHPLKKERLITFSELMQFNVHDNSYCACVKSCPTATAKCLATQKKVLAKCEKEREPFEGVCYAGVREIVYPIFSHEEVVGFISVSGYAAARGASPTEVVKACFSSHEGLCRTYGTLKKEAPSREKIDTLLFPLCDMLALAYLKEEAEDSEAPITRMLRYIKHHYAEALTSEDICRHFSFSRSYFSHVFKRETGVSFKEYLTVFRMENAKRLLRYSSLSVTEIAFSVGFSEAGYFSAVFKEKTGLSPREYKKAAV